MIPKFYTPVMISIGTILNLLTIMVFCRAKMRKYCISLSMICLAISDTGVLSIPVLFTWLDDHYYDTYFLNNTIWCNLHAYVDLVFCANSSWVIILISTERWFAIYKPFKKSRIFTNNRVAWTLLFLFMLAVFIFIRIPLSMQIVQKQNSNETECTIISETSYRIIGILSIILIYVMPSIILAILNIMIIIRLRIRPFSSASMRSRKLITQKRMTRNVELSEDNNRSISVHNSKPIVRLSENPIKRLSVPQSFNNKNNSSCNSRSNNSSKNDRNLSITLVTVAIVFMILTFPFQGYWFYENFYIHISKSISKNIRNASSSNSATEKDPIPIDSISTFRKITFTIKNLNYVINFFLYSALSTLFREEFFAIFTQFHYFKKSTWFKEAKQIEKPRTIAEIEFPISPFIKASNKRNILKIRIESSSLKYYLNERKRRSRSLFNSNNKNRHSRAELIELNVSTKNKKSILKTEDPI